MGRNELYRERGIAVSPVGGNINLIGIGGNYLFDAAQGQLTLTTFIG